MAAGAYQARIVALKPKPRLAERHAGVREFEEKRLELARNWLKITGYRAKKVVHSSGHKPPSAFLPKPYFAGFLKRARPSVENPSLSATDLRGRKSPSKSGASRTAGK
jgi:hypothetical protein